MRKTCVIVHYTVSRDRDLSFSFLPFIILFSEAMDKIRKNLLNYFWNMPDITNIQIPDGANTTSTTKVSKSESVDVILRNQFLVRGFP